MTTAATAAAWLALALAISITLNVLLFIIWRRTNKMAGLIDETLERTQKRNMELIQSQQDQDPRAKAARVAFDSAKAAWVASDQLSR